MRYTEVRGRRIHYIDEGKGQPILFGHSYLWDSEMWRPQVTALSEDFRCIVPDLWAHGGSENLPEGHISVEQFAEDMALFTQKLELPAVHVVGLSVGGMWGANLAWNHPDCVRSLVLMDTDLGMEPEPTRLKYFHMFDQISEIGLIPPPLAEAISRLFFSPKTLENDSDLPKKFNDSLQSIAPAAIDDIIRIGKAIFSRADNLKKLASINCPTLIMTGKDDIPRPITEAERLAERIRNSELLIVPEAGHISNLEQPEFVNLALRDFFNSQTL